MADLATNLKIVEHLGDSTAKALTQGSHGRPSRYFDPGHYLEYFKRFEAAVNELRALDSRFLAVPKRPLPEPSKTTDFEGRGYLLRQHLDKLKEDIDLTLAIAKQPPVGSMSAATPDPRKVFVVHGRNLKASGAMFDFLRALDLEPIEWREAIKMTGKGTPYVGEVLDVAFAHAQAIVVVFTGDDLAQLDPRLTHPGEKDKDVRAQPRPNVLFEAGMALGRNPDRTIIVEVGAVASFSDIHGRHTVRMDGSAETRRDLATRLKTAQCSVRDQDRDDWLRAGDFADAALPAAKGTVSAPAEGHFLAPYVSKIVRVDDSTISGKNEFRVKQLNQWSVTLHKLSNDTDYTISLDQIVRHQVVADQMILFLKSSWGEYQVAERMATRAS